MEAKADVVLVGGGLANGLLALRLLQRRPELRVLVLEQEAQLGGNHTWSFHSSDLKAAELDWVRTLITKSWPSYRVFFPGHARTLEGGYHSLSSRDFHERLSLLLGDRVCLGASVRSLAPGEVVLRDGMRIAAACVVDGRGFRQDVKLSAGYQKFLGLDLELEQPHGEADPILMDGRVRQGGNLRFFYTLPWSERRIHVGEARYSDSPEVNREEFREGVFAYLDSRGWKWRTLEREEVGVLPAPLTGRWKDIAGEGDVPRSGVRAGLFHATTGYSLPFAVRFADAICALPQVTSPAVLAKMRAMSQREWKRARYFRLLNRMLFRAAEPDERLRMFEQFYRRPAGLIGRFYAARLRFVDHVRIMTGKPPVPLGRALKAFLRF